MTRFRLPRAPRKLEEKAKQKEQEYVQARQGQNQPPDLDSSRRQPESPPPSSILSISTLSSPVAYFHSPESIPSPALPPPGQPETDHKSPKHLPDDTKFCKDKPWEARKRTVRKYGRKRHEYEVERRGRSRERRPRSPGPHLNTKTKRASGILGFFESKSTRREGKHRASYMYPSRSSSRAKEKSHLPDPPSQPRPQDAPKISRKQHPPPPTCSPPRGGPQTRIVEPKILHTVYKDDPRRNYDSGYETTTSSSKLPPQVQTTGTDPKPRILHQATHPDDLPTAYHPDRGLGSSSPVRNSHSQPFTNPHQQPSNAEIRREPVQEQVVDQSHGTSEKYYARKNTRKNKSDDRAGSTGSDKGRPRHDDDKTRIAAATPTNARGSLDPNNLERFRKEPERRSRHRSRDRTRDRIKNRSRHRSRHRSRERSRHRSRHRSREGRQSNVREGKEDKEKRSAKNPKEPKQTDKASTSGSEEYHEKKDKKKNPTNLEIGKPRAVRVLEYLSGGKREKVTARMR